MFLVNQNKDKVYNLNKIYLIRLYNKEIIMLMDDGIGHNIGSFKDKESAQLAFEDIINNIQRETKIIYV